MPNNRDRNKHNRNNKTKGTKRNAAVNKKSSARSEAKNAELKKNKNKNRNRNSNTDKKEKSKSKHPKLMMCLKIFLVLFLLACVVGAGIVAGIFFGLFGDDFEITKEELKIGASNSRVVDKNGVEIANLSGDEKRKIIKLEDMSDYLPKAYVAIEDERFYKHNGVDIKRTAGAILKTLTGNRSYGGSTITQQLVKNITKDDQSAGLAGIVRKIKEWAKAYQVERMISKEQILELYLNILYVGGEGNLHGVELGAEYYFNKSAKDLTLEECAFLAGINSSPNIYNPYTLTLKDDTEEKRDKRIKNKTLTVLAKMKELGYITNEEEYNAAVAKAEEGLKFSKGAAATGSNYSYHIDATIDQVIDQVMEEKGISRQLAENYVYSSGLTIYSTVDTNIQNRMDEEYKKEKYIKKGYDKKNGKQVNDHTQSAMAVVDYKTGHVLGISGGLGEKTAGGWNRATQMKRQTGSVIKPIADVAIGLEERIITPATVYNDVKTNYGGNYEPKNDGHKYRGYINIRQFIATSQNQPALKIMKELTPKKAIPYFKKMGYTSLDEEDDVLGFAIGGMKHGASPLEMAAIYGTIANGGVYIPPTFYTKVVDSNGNTVLEPKQEQVRVFSEQTAYLVTSITQEPVKGGGTATYCAISGMNVAAKTGTTDHNYDRWLCGFTPYYAAATWFGYDTNEEVRYRDFQQNPAGQIWDAVMTDIHKGLAKANYTKPEGIVEQTVCRTTGCLATTGCTETYREMFATNNLPTKCPGHGSQMLCAETNLVANDYCPEKKPNIFGVVPPKEQLKLWKTIGGTSQVGKEVTEVCTVHKKPEEPEKPKEPAKNNTTNNTNKTNNTNSSGGKNNTSGGNTNTGGGKNNTSGGNTNTGGKNNTAGGNTSKEKKILNIKEKFQKNNLINR